MELFLAQNHSAMTHLPLACAILGAVAAVAALFVRRNEAGAIWAVLSIAALVTAIPAAVTGRAAAQGRFNLDGKPYLESGLLVGNSPANERIYRHQSLGLGGMALSVILSAAALLHLRGRRVNKVLAAALAVLLAILWAYGGHLGGEEIWSPETFPGFQ